MTIKEIQDCDDIGVLREQINILHTKNGIIFRHLEEYKDAKYSNISKKEELNINNNTIETIKEKIIFLNVECNRINYNFKKLTKLLISKQSYKELYELSKLSFTESKNKINIESQLKLKI